MKALPTILTLLATATLTGQTKPPQPPQPPAPQSQTTQAPRFVSQVDLVTLDVTVRDKNGQFVPNLSKDDFTILEDGVEQSLADFRLVYGGRELSVEMINAPTAAPDGMILPPTRPVADVAGRVFIIFIDDLHLLASDSPRVRQLLTQVTNTLIHDGDMFAVVSTGPSSIEVNSTYDRSRLTEAIKKVMGNGMSPEDILLAPSSTSGPQEIRHRVNVAFSTAYDLLEQMKTVNTRRKAFIYLSAGYDFNPFTDSRWKQEQERYSMPSRDSTDGNTNNSTENSTNSSTINPFDSGSFGFAGADLVSQLSELTKAANRANATMYTIDPRGLIAGPDINNQTLTTQEWRRYVQTTVDSLKTIADLTGGFCICNSNDFKRGLERIDAETSDYYLIRYYSSNPDPLRRVRNLQVKLKRTDLEVVQKRTQWSLPIPRKR
jgi:VWFA-related protein